MQGLFLLAFFVAIIVVIHWAKANDSVPLDGRMTGLFRMPFPDPSDDAKSAPGSTNLRTRDGTSRTDR